LGLVNRKKGILGVIFLTSLKIVTIINKKTGQDFTLPVITNASPLKERGSRPSLLFLKRFKEREIRVDKSRVERLL